MFRSKSQSEFDTSRKTYSVVFPSDLHTDRVEAFLRSIGETVKSKPSRFSVSGVPTIVFEVIASQNGITHRLHVPEVDAEYIIGQLDAHIPGTDVTPFESSRDVWDYAVQLHMTDPVRTMPFNRAEDYTTRLLKAVQTDYPDEAVMMQWVITGTSKIKAPSQSKAVQKSKPSYLDALFFGTIADNEEVKDRQDKAHEQNFSAVGRVAARAGKGETRAIQLVNDVVRALKSENATNKFTAKRIQYEKLDEQVTMATMPLFVDVQFTVPEIVPVLAWPIGSPAIPGLPQGSAKRIPASESIPREGEGRLLGHSNVSGRERPIVQPFDGANNHKFVGGKTGRGKTVHMANDAYFDMQAGKGVIVIDASASRSPETLYNRVLQYVPKHRLNDVVAFDVIADADHPIGFNLFDQGMGRGVIDQLVGVFSSLYPSIAGGVAVRDLLYHGVWTLIEHGGLTLVDLAALISPNKSEEAWSRSVRESMTIPELKDFWVRVTDAKGNVEPRYAEPLHNKLWQITGRPEVKNVIGQTESTLKIADVLSGNKILLLSLAGLPKETAELFASIVTGSIWSIAQSIEPPTSNFLYLDEFQVSANVQSGLDDMLARARKHKLGITLATQYLETVRDDLRVAIKNNTSTRVIYETSSTEAKLWVPEFGGRGKFSEIDFTRIRQHEAIGVVSLGKETSDAFTMRALPPKPPTGMADQARHMSRMVHGRPIGGVTAQMNTRRVASKVAPTRTAKKPTGRTSWQPRTPYKRDEE